MFTLLWWGATLSSLLGSLQVMFGGPGKVGIESRSPLCKVKAQLSFSLTLLSTYSKKDRNHFPHCLRLCWEKNTIQVLFEAPWDFQDTKQLSSFRSINRVKICSPQVSWFSTNYTLSGFLQKCQHSRPHQFAPILCSFQILAKDQLNLILLWQYDVHKKTFLNVSHLPMFEHGFLSHSLSYFLLEA